MNSGGLAQNVRPPIAFKSKKSIDIYLILWYNSLVKILGCRQAVRHQTLTLALVGSNPAIQANKKRTFVYQKFSFCLSKPQAWYIITTQSSISSPPLGLYLITRQRVFSLRLDDIQHVVLMIYNASHWWYATLRIDDIHAFGVIGMRKVRLCFRVGLCSHFFPWEPPNGVKYHDQARLKEGIIVSHHAKRA